MIRSVCMLSRSYPIGAPSSGAGQSVEALATGLVAHGVAVHVITNAPDNENRRVLRDGVAVHAVRRVTSGTTDAPELERSLWSLAAAQYYRMLDVQVDFDIVLAPDLFGESLKLVRGPHTALVVQAFGGLPFTPASERAEWDPSTAVACAFELEAIQHADALVATSSVLAGRATKLFAGQVEVIAPAFSAEDFPSLDMPASSGPLELLYRGTFDERGADDVALRVLAELRQRGRDAHLTLLGPETPEAAGRHRREVLLGGMDRLGLGFDSVRVLHDPSPEVRLAHLRQADALISAARTPAFALDTIEALASGRPVVTSSCDLASEWMDGDPALFHRSLDDEDRFVAAAADFLGDLGSTRSSRAPARVRGLFSPTRIAAAYLELFERLERRPRFDRRLREPSRRNLKLGIVVSAHSGVASTRRCLESLLEHTSVPASIVVVDNSSLQATGAIVADLDDARLAIVRCETHLGVGATRNLGLSHLDGDEDYVVFLDDDTEVLAKWWEPFLLAMEREPLAGLVGQVGRRIDWDSENFVATPVSGGPIAACDLIDGSCMFLRFNSLSRIGRFDERFGPMWHEDDDLALRAARTGEHVLAVQSRTVLHHVSSRVPDAEGLELARRNRGYLIQKRLRQQLSPTTPFLLLASAEEVLADPRLLATYTAAFTASDAVALVIFGPGLDPVQYEVALGAAAIEAGFDLEHGPRLIALLPPTASPEDERAIADEVFAVLSAVPPSGVFGHIAWHRPETSPAIRLHAARMWFGRPSLAEHAVQAPMEVASA